MCVATQKNCVVERAQRILHATRMLNTNIAPARRSRRGLPAAMARSLVIPFLLLFARSQDGTSLFVRVLRRCHMVRKLGAATGGLYRRFGAGGTDLEF